MLKSFSYIFFKRVFDITFSIIILFTFSPIFFIVSFLVKVSSPGPVFYKGVRVGRYRKPFRIFKFRSMYRNSDIFAGSTSKNDPRITKIGKFLRRYKIDELPQFVNVLRGEMSVVGPRPELKKYTDQYKGDELLILNAKPGITDFASLNFSNLNDLIDDVNPDLSYEKNILKSKNLLRIKYVKNSSFFVDIKLIILTILKVVFKQ